VESCSQSSTRSSSWAMCQDTSPPGSSFSLAPTAHLHRLRFRACEPCLIGPTLDGLDLDEMDEASIPMRGLVLSTPRRARIHCFSLGSIGVSTPSFILSLHIAWESLVLASLEPASGETSSLRRFSKSVSKFLHSSHAWREKRSKPARTFTNVKCVARLRACVFVRVCMHACV